MPEILMTVTDKGQVTIPAAVRRHLKIERGQTIALVLEADGTVRLKQPGYGRIADIRGAAGELGRNLTWAQMRTLAREGRGKASRAAAA
jgi:AbrB family looped-hinge helix DNA binding protein